MIGRCFGQFLVFHAKTAWVHVGFMKWYLDGLYKRWIAHEKLEFQGFFFSIFLFLRKGRICRISTDPWIQMTLSLQVQKDGYIGKLQTSKRKTNWHLLKKDPFVAPVAGILSNLLIFYSFHHIFHIKQVAEHIFFPPPRHLQIDSFDSDSVISGASGGESNCCFFTKKRS